MINIHSLEFSYPGAEFHLSIPEFEVRQGEKLAVIGPSGSGKTTLLNLIAGIIVPENGSVTVDETRIDQLVDADRRSFRINNVGFVFQDFELLDYLDVYDNILHPFRISHALKLTSEIRERLLMLAKSMGISQQLKSTPGNLSQGEKQRAAICRTLLPNPKLILADEATGNLDPENKLHILDLLFQAVDKHEATLLAVTHDHELLTHFDRVVDFQDFRETVSK